jgi:hypothetical protein
VSQGPTVTVTVSCGQSKLGRPSLCGRLGHMVRAKRTSSRAGLSGGKLIFVFTNSSRICVDFDRSADVSAPGKAIASTSVQYAGVPGCWRQDSRRVPASRPSKPISSRSLITCAFATPSAPATAVQFGLPVPLAGHHLQGYEPRC